MAQITLITGQPGHGKSLYAITLGLKFLQEGREVYAAGFKDLDYAATGFKPLPHDFRDFDRTELDDQGRILCKWQQLPNGPVIILDECYDYIPQRAAGKPVPPHVDSLARHRHTGHDIILVTQKHDQIDSFVKGLIGLHIHVRRKFGLNAAALRKWDAFASNVKASDTTEVERWVYPKKNYALYKSATQHSVKRKLPWFVYALPLALVACIGFAWWSWHSFAKMGQPSTGATGAVATGATGVRPLDGDHADDDLRHRDFAAWLKPRLAAQPWTAPAFDKLQPQGVPDLYCIAVDDGRCHCVTEQGTDYDVAPKLCRVIARHGSYNPFRVPLRDHPSGGPARESRADSDVVVGSPKLVVPGGAAAEPAGPSGGLPPAAYVPPGYAVPSSN